MSEAKQPSWKSWNRIIEVRHTIAVASQRRLDKGGEGLISDSWSAICVERNRSSRDQFL